MGSASEFAVRVARVGSLLWIAVHNVTAAEDGIASLTVLRDEVG